MGTYPSGFGISEHAKHKGGMAAGWMLALLRVGYIFNR